jgi:hypothetical protein
MVISDLDVTWPRTDTATERVQRVIAVFSETEWEELTEEEVSRLVDVAG